MTNAGDFHVDLRSGMASRAERDLMTSAASPEGFRKPQLLGVLFPALLYPHAATLMALTFPSSGFLLDHFENIHSHLLYITHSTSSPNSHLPGLAASWHGMLPSPLDCGVMPLTVFTMHPDVT